MAEILPFNETARLKKLLEDKDLELLEAQKALSDAKEKLGYMISVNELLRLQIQDLLNLMGNLGSAIQTTTNNLKGIQAKLPKF
jgi:regulator of replication initiation timing